MQKIEISNVKEKVMLGMLNISTWTGRAFDNHATKKVETSYDTIKVGRFNKDLMPNKPESFAAIKRIEARLRALFETYTLEYEQLGVRLMTTGIYLDWTEKLRSTQLEFDCAVQTFLDDFPNIQLEAQKRLGPLYNEFDYPNVFNLREKFSIRFAVLPFPDAEQFGVDLPDADIQTIRSQLTANMQQAVDFAYSDLSSRLYEATLKLAQRASSDGRFYASTIDNLQEIIAILPKLNFTGDARLTRLAEMASRELTVFNAEAIRTSPSIRSEVADKATQIAFDMSEYMGIAFDNTLLDERDQSNARMSLLAA